MHPFLRSIRHLLLMGLFWSPIVFCIILLQSSLSGAGLGKATVLVGPPMLIELFICLSAWYPCKAISTERYNLLQVLFRHTLAALLLSFIWLLSTALYSEILDYLTKQQVWRNLFNQAVPLLLAVGLFLYLMVALIYYLFLTMEKTRQMEQVALENHLVASRAELNSLKASIHPHFLFNSLTALSTLTRSDPEKAQEMSLQLADFLRYSLSYGREDLVQVKNELEHIDNYLGIEKQRLGEKLQLDFAIEPDTRAEKLPPFSLLPLIENAIKHSIQQSLQTATLTLKIQKRAGFMNITVINPWERSFVTEKKSGYGLIGLKKRLAGIYGDKATLTAKKDQDRYTVVLQVPLLPEKNDV